jgi:uncharacterized protein YjbJ (UPF0337 family)
MHFFRTRAQYRAPEQSAWPCVPSPANDGGWELAMGSTADKVSGAANEALGKAKQGVGSAVGSEKMKTEGKRQQAKGDAQQAASKAKDAASEDADHLPPGEQDMLGENE